MSKSLSQQASDQGENSRTDDPEDVILQADGISKHFGGVTALEDINLTIERGEVHGLIGENGAGKSTLMNIIAGVITDYEGTLYLNGQGTTFGGVRDAEDKGLGMIHQDLSVVNELSIAENIFLGKYKVNNYFGVEKIDWGRMVKVAKDHLNEVTNRDLDSGLPVKFLDYGMKQLVEIAKVVFTGADLIIMDEPTSALSDKESQVLFDIIRSLVDGGKTIIFISHYLGDVLEVSDRITILRNGRKIDTLDVDESGTKKATLIQSMLGTEKELDARSEDYQKGLEQEPEGQPALSLRDWSTDNLSSINLDIHEGEILGLLGLLGAGQADVGRSIFGLTPGVTGTMTLDGEGRFNSPSEAKERGVAYLPPDRSVTVFSDKECYKTLTLPYLPELRDEEESRLVRSNWEIDITQEQVERFNIKLGEPSDLANSLSGGNQQKLALAKWLTINPRILVLEGPTRGVDVGAKDEIMNIIKRLKESGMAILVISEEPGTVLDFSDRIEVFKDGKIAESFEDRMVTKNELIESMQ